MQNISSESEQNIVNTREQYQKFREFAQHLNDLAIIIQVGFDSAATEHIVTSNILGFSYQNDKLGASAVWCLDIDLSSAYEVPNLYCDIPAFAYLSEEQINLLIQGRFVDVELIQDFETETNELKTNKFVVTIQSLFEQTPPFF